MTQLSLSKKFQKPVFLFWIRRCISRTTNFTPKYIENKRKSFLHTDSEHPKLQDDSIPYRVTKKTHQTLVKLLKKN